MTKRTYETEWLKNLRGLDNAPNFVSTLDNVAKFGWEAMLVTGNDQRTSFAYTVGLQDTMGLPEIIVVGLKRDIAHSALNYSVKAMQAGTDLTVGRKRGIVGEVEVEFRPVGQRWFRHVMCRADWYYGYGEGVIPALQLIYPDLDGRFQWDEGFNEYFRQPLLQPDVSYATIEKDFWASNDPDSSLFDWRFPDDPHTAAYLSASVHSGQEAITYVSHDSDGDWQFLGNSMANGGEPVLACLHHLIDNDPTLKDLSDLPAGWYATRENRGAPWERFEHGPEEET